MPAAASTGTRRLPASRVKPSGTWGLWLHAQRTKPGQARTQKSVFDELRTRWPDLFPWQSGSSLDSYRAFEKGKAPDADQQAAFLALYPSAAPPADNQAGTLGDDTRGVPAAYLTRIDALVERMAEDQALIRDLLELVRPTADRAIENSARIRALEAELESLRAGSGAGA